MESSNLVGWHGGFLLYPTAFFWSKLKSLKGLENQDKAEAPQLWSPTILKLRSSYFKQNHSVSMKSGSFKKLILDKVKTLFNHKNNPNISMTIFLSDTANLFAHWIFQIDQRQLMEHGRNGWFGSTTVDVEWFAQRRCPRAYIALDDSLLIFGWDIWQVMWAETKSPNSAFHLYVGCVWRERSEWQV